MANILLDEFRQMAFDAFRRLLPAVSRNSGSYLLRFSGIIVSPNAVPPRKGGNPLILFFSRTIVGARSAGVQDPNTWFASASTAV